MASIQLYTQSKFTIEDYNHQQWKDQFDETMEVAGVLVPWESVVDGEEKCHYKLVLDNGVELTVLSDPNWDHTLSLFEWWRVKLDGIINEDSQVVTPTAICPTYTKERVIEN